MGSSGGVGLKKTRWGHRAPQGTLTIVASNHEPVWVSSPAGHLQSWKQSTYSGAWGGSNPTLSASIACAEKPRAKGYVDTVTAVSNDDQ